MKKHVMIAIAAIASSALMGCSPPNPAALIAQYEAQQAAKAAAAGGAVAATPVAVSAAATNTKLNGQVITQSVKVGQDLAKIKGEPDIQPASLPTNQSTAHWSDPSHKPASAAPAVPAATNASAAPPILPSSVPAGTGTSAAR